MTQTDEEHRHIKKSMIQNLNARQNEKSMLQVISQEKKSMIQHIIKDLKLRLERKDGVEHRKTRLYEESVN
mgnify:CR=1 FL=1